MKVYIDESVYPAISNGLRRRDVEAVDVREEGNIGMSDKEQLEFADKNNLVIFTFDDDFIRLVNRLDLTHPGIIYCDQRKYSIGEIIRRLEAVVETRSEEEITSNVIYL
ncbi:MAG: DUF5615 family PIN-like protein [Candidatus Nanohaloarchaea archaeon]|nr:DUF5615 family PIN-like protein [Candidatus Nanohaloarchaea archaeon]